MTFFIRRALAFFVDYIIIATYIVILLVITLSIRESLGVSIETPNPITGQIIAFFSLTLPVFFYSYLLEKGKHSATLGKRLLGIKVVASNNKPVLIRNIFKYLPWEIAHIGVHWIYYYENLELTTPIWVWICLIVPEVVVFTYFISIYGSKGKKAVYDSIAKTSISLKSAQKHIGCR